MKQNLIVIGRKWRIMGRRRRKPVPGNVKFGCLEEKKTGEFILYSIRAMTNFTHSISYLPRISNPIEETNTLERKEIKYSRGNTYWREKLEKNKKISATSASERTHAYRCSTTNTRIVLGEKESATFAFFGVK